MLSNQQIDVEGQLARQKLGHYSHIAAPKYRQNKWTISKNWQSFEFH